METRRLVCFWSGKTYPYTDRVWQLSARKIKNIIPIPCIQVDLSHHSFPTEFHPKDHVTYRYVDDFFTFSLLLDEHSYGWLISGSTPTQWLQTLVDNECSLTTRGCSRPPPYTIQPLRFRANNWNESLKYALQSLSNFPPRCEPCIEYIPRGRHDDYNGEISFVQYCVPDQEIIPSKLLARTSYLRAFCTSFLSFQLMCLWRRL